jgi:translation initiation factor IF-2
LRSLTDEERESRSRALSGAREREVEERKRAEIEAKAREEREARERDERAAAEARKREEESRRAQDAEAKRRSETEAKRRLAGGEPAPAPAASALRKASAATAMALAGLSPAPKSSPAEDDEVPHLIRRPGMPVKTNSTPAGAPGKKPRPDGRQCHRGREERTRSVAAFAAAFNGSRVMSTLPRKKLTRK